MKPPFFLGTRKSSWMCTSPGAVGGGASEAALLAPVAASAGALEPALSASAADGAAGAAAGPAALALSPPSPLLPPSSAGPLAPAPAPSADAASAAPSAPFDSFCSSIAGVACTERGPMESKTAVSATDCEVNALRLTPPRGGQCVAAQAGHSTKASCTARRGSVSHSYTSLPAQLIHEQLILVTDLADGAAVVQNLPSCEQRRWHGSLSAGASSLTPPQGGATRAAGLCILCPDRVSSASDGPTHFIDVVAVHVRHQ